MKKVFFLLSLVLLATFFAFSQGSESFEVRQVAESKRFVNFLFKKGNNNTLEPWGTGFFVGKKADSLYYVFCATAKHLLRDTSGNFLTQIFLRYNLKNGGVGMSPINLVYQGEERNVYLPEDPTVDIALISLVGDFAALDISILFKENMLPRSEFIQNGIAEGTEVFFAGLFVNYIGEKKNYPITRFGKIALLGEEKINFVDTSRDVILLETTAYGGNSGSPVFVNYSSGQYHIRKLIGIMTGCFEQFNNLSILTKSSILSKENVGISVISPCSYLIELLDSIK